MRACGVSACGVRACGVRACGVRACVRACVCQGYWNLNPMDTNRQSLSCVKS